MNVYLNGSLAQMPFIHTDVLLSPKKRATLPFASTLFVLYQILQYVYFFYEVINNQTPSLRQDVNLLRENIDIFMNVTYLNMFHICFYKIYNMIPLLCTKVNFI